MFDALFPDDLTLLEDLFSNISDFISIHFLRLLWYRLFLIAYLRIRSFAAFIEKWALIKMDTSLGVEKGTTFTTKVTDIKVDLGILIYYLRKKIILSFDLIKEHLKK